MKKRILSLALALALCLGLSVPASAVGNGSNEFLDSGSTSMTKLSKEEIAQLLADNSLTMPTQVFDVQPSTSAPYSPGAVSNAALQAAVDRLNALRRIAGVPAVELDAALCENAQYGAVLLAASEFSHSPSQPTDMEDSFYKTAKSATSSSNISAGSTLTGAIDSFMDDSDTSNINVLGHRRWQLNPEMGKVGFGYATASSGYGRYVTEKVFDRSGAGCDYDFISWPASGNFPDNLSAFDQNTAWSVTLNPEKYRMPLNQVDVTVTLARESDGKTWTFQGNGYTASSTGAFFRTDCSNYGVSNCIIFRPDGVEMYEGVYTVTIDGLKSASGSPVDFSYQVDFFDPDNIGAEPEPSDKQESQGFADNKTAFTDVPITHWAYTSIQKMAAEGVMNGVGNNRFNPTGTITYGEFFTMMTRAFYPKSLALAETKQYESRSWWMAAISTADATGLMNNTALDAMHKDPWAFGLNEPWHGWWEIERDSVAQTIANLLTNAGYSVTEAQKNAARAEIRDLDDGYEMRKDAVAMVYALGLMQGDDQGNFRPKGDMTRAEAAVIMDRLLDFGITVTNDNATTFKYATSTAATP